MKKYVSIIVCAVLLVFAFISDIPAKSEIISGRGNGADSKVTNAQELVEVLNYFTNYEMRTEEESSTKPSNGLFAFKQKEEVQKYKSATFYNKSKASIDSTYIGIDKSGKSGQIKDATTFTRELTINFTETAALYHSVGIVMRRSLENSMIFDFDFYMYITTQVCYVKFNRFDITGDESAPDITNNMLKKWFDCSDSAELQENLISINEENLKILGLLGEYFEENKFSKFGQKNKKYVLENNYIKEAFSFIFGAPFPDDWRGEFTVNLAEETQPKIRLIGSYYFDGDEYSIQQCSEENVTFSYINNTVIDASRLPKNPPMLEEYLD